MRTVGRIALTLGGVGILGIAAFFIMTQWIIRESHARPLPNIAADRRPAALAEGQRLARIGFCLGCHGEHGEGDTIEEPAGVVAMAPALAGFTHDWSDAQIARAIRYGVARDGSAIHVMPIDRVGVLADDDLADVIRWVRSLRPSRADVTKPGIRWTVGARWALLTDKLRSGVMPASIERPAHRPADIGAYFVAYSCTQCHRLHQDRQEGSLFVPALAPIAAAYDPAAFRHLLRTGEGMRPGDLGWMTRVARSNLRYLSDDEIAAIQAYLRHEAANQPSQ